MTNDTGRMTLYIRSILWDLGVPQEAATILYEDNDGTTAMANAGKPTPRSRHINIKHYALQEWCERDLMVLKRIDTSINMADHFTKPLACLLFHRHCDFYMGFVPPTYSPKYAEVARIYSVPTKLAPVWEHYFSAVILSEDQQVVAARAAKCEALWMVIVQDYYYNTMMPIY
eukprot:CCRYP_016805-RA/>CCRYP_016805-RA protein AED:0.61 eAED:0.42 QI:0/-1/0/1/-1/1/1/0/171